MVLPNQLTILRIILTPVFFVLFIIEDPVTKQISLGVFVIAALTDWYDGWLARKFNYITPWGKFWDPLADKILTSAAFIGLVIPGIVELWMVIVILLRDFLITGLRAYADYKEFSFPTSYYAKWKTMLQMVLLYYLLLLFVVQYSPLINDLYGNLISLLLNKQLVYFIALFITLITFHSGVLYITRNRKIILKLLKIEN